MNASHSVPVTTHSLPTQWIKSATVAVTAILVLGLVSLQQTLDQRRDPLLAQIEDLSHLPNGEYLKPALLGFHHLGADVLWLRTIQVLGKTTNTQSEYDWLYHAFDVITSLDPQYDYVYWVSGVVLTELANRPDLSNRLLEKGLAAVPDKWLIPYLLAYNNYFYLGDVDKAVVYARRAAEIPSSPPWMINMVTQMSARAGNPEFALAFLMRMHQQNDDPRIKESLEYHMKEVIIERDIRALEALVKQFEKRERRYPQQLTELVTRGYTPTLPQEPFGGAYVIEAETGRVSSSVHMERLKMYAAPGSEAKKREGQ